MAATRGEVLGEDHRPVEAYFHASCGGTTEDGENALGRDLPYLKSVNCPCQGHTPYSHWRVEVARDDLGRLLGLQGERIQDLGSRLQNRDRSSQDASVAEPTAGSGP